MSYAAPVEAIAFVLTEIAGFEPDGLSGILEEAGRFAAERLAPLNQQGDREGAHLRDGAVAMPEGWAQTYRDWIAAGWNGMDLPERWGGMGLPTRLATAGMELWTSACMAFALGPVLNQGAADALDLHGSEDLKQLYLPKMVSGEWAATMNLTEPQAGSDLGALRTRAAPLGDGRYKITGQKIFITFGDHDLTDNIIHLVLARLTDAPPGPKGISLFLAPKFLLNPDRSLGARNDIRCTRLERKLGIHASPTCAMSFGDEEGGAIGWLIGQENRGLACMFTMMNKARLYTGLQGVAIAERATQQAMAYAKLRRQGRAPGADPSQSSAIIEHPDVRRNLMTMKALTAAARAVAYSAAEAIDRAISEEDPAKRAHAAELAALLTPITKAYCSDLGVEVASIGVQVHGGMGFVEETGAAQYLRDARIAPIYEGTNGIQAIDLALRKVLRPGSRIMAETIADFRRICGDAAEAGLPDLGASTEEALDALALATDFLSANANDRETLLAVASPYLRLAGVACAAAYLTKGAARAAQRMKSGENAPVLTDAVTLAQFYATNVAVAGPSLAKIILNSAAGLKVDALTADFR